MFRKSFLLFLLSLLFSSYSFARCVYVNNHDGLQYASSSSKFLFINGIAYGNFDMPDAENEDLSKFVAEGFCKEIEQKSHMDLIRKFQLRMSKEQIDCFVLHGPEVGYVIKPNSTQQEIASSRFLIKFLSVALKRASCRSVKGGTVAELVK